MTGRERHAPTCSAPYQPCTCGHPVARSPKKSEPPPPAEITNQELSALQDSIEPLVARRVRICRPASYVGEHEGAQYKPGSIRVMQRCFLCGEDVVAYVADYGTKLEIVGAIGTCVRLSYFKHRCPPVEQSLLGATYDELEEMFAMLEREGTAMIERAAEIDKIKRARVA